MSSAFFTNINLDTSELEYASPSPVDMEGSKQNYCYYNLNKNICTNMYFEDIIYIKVSYLKNISNIKYVYQFKTLKITSDIIVNMQTFCS